MNISFSNLNICVEVKGDGNCLFRSISDQIEGTDSNHKFYRKAAVNIIY